MLVPATTAGAGDDESKQSTGIEPFLRLAPPHQKTAVLATFVVEDGANNKRTNHQNDSCYIVIKIRNSHKCESKHYHDLS